jgi:hypothetical protein
MLECFHMWIACVKDLDIKIKINIQEMNDKFWLKYHGTNK